MSEQRGRGRIGWGLGDFFLAWFASLVLATITGIALLGTGVEVHLDCRPPDAADVGGDVRPSAPIDELCPAGEILTFDGEDALSVEATFGAVIAAQALGAVGVLAAVTRWKGQRSLRRDFGWELRPRDWPYLFWGMASTVALGLAVYPLIRLIDDAEEQPLVDLLAQVRSPIELVLAFLGVVVLAPAVEELLFRGVMLRSLQRRLPDVGAIVAQGLLFSLAHALGNVGGGVSAVVQLATLAIFGMLLGTVAVRSGSTSRSMLLHAGFNLIGLLQGLAA
jgi:membrane protease YdiL (CAAX protease family)